MTFDQAALFTLLLVLFGLLVWGRFRYDVVAFGALFAAAVLGLVPRDEIFAGFGHPATMIIALVLIVSRGLVNSGVVEVLGRLLSSASRGVGMHVSLMAGVAAALSAIINNVAALALLMPIDVEAARKAKRSPSLTLMPLSFASILGGMVTLIGTPPNVVIATFREGVGGEPFGMFSFTPVGIVVALVGVSFVSLVGWRLIPRGRRDHDTLRELEGLQGYVVEARVKESSKAIDRAFDDVRAEAEERDVVVLGVIRHGRRLREPDRSARIRAEDVLVLEGAPEALEPLLSGLELEVRHEDADGSPGLASETLAFAEAVVPEGALAEHRSARTLRLGPRDPVTLIGVSRRGQRLRERVRSSRVQAGDVLLLMGQADRLDETVARLGCLRLRDRGVHVMQRHKAWLALALFAVAIALASLGWLYLPIALAGVVGTYVLFQIVPLSQVYTSIEWPVIVLIGSLIPIGKALETSGGTTRIAEGLLAGTEGLPAWGVLVVLMIVTMTLSDVLNNVATALIAAPIAIRVAETLHVNTDPFLMAVAVASSCAFLTPIGHKNNTIILGPGGYRFGDYWRLGLPLELLVVLVATPTILWVWPLY